jgi:hypothetical protein
MSRFQRSILPSRSSPSPLDLTKHDSPSVIVRQIARSENRESGVRRSQKVRYGHLKSPRARDKFNRETSGVNAPWNGRTVIQGTDRNVRISLNTMRRGALRVFSHWPSKVVDDRRRSAARDPGHDRRERNNWIGHEEIPAFGRKLLKRTAKFAPTFLGNGNVDLLVLVAHRFTGTQKWCQMNR